MYVCKCVFFCVHVLCVFVFFLFKQKTAYEMRISDWSSDVCSSDLESPRHSRTPRPLRGKRVPWPRSGGFKVSEAVSARQHARFRGLDEGENAVSVAARFSGRVVVCSIDGAGTNGPAPGATAGSGR